MPNDPGPSSWLPGQYRKFLDGLEQTGTANAPRLARAQVSVRVEPGKDPRISIPHWDDVIRTGPRTPVTEQDRNIQRHFDRAGLPSPLSADVQREIAHRRAIAERIRNSAIPEYQRGVSTMLTAVDNVQDASLSLAVGGRLMVAALGRFGGWIAPAVAGLGKFALGLNWLGLALTWLGVAYAWICQGPREAASAVRSGAMAGYLFKGIRAVSPRAKGIGIGLAAASKKGMHGMNKYGVPSGREPHNKRASKWARARPSFAEALQIGQTAYDFTGYGVALGAIMGFSSETAYAGARKQQGEKVTLRSPAVNHALAGVLSSRIAGLGRGALYHRWQCSRALASAPIILRAPQFFGDELYGLAWIAFYASLEPLMWDTQGIPWRDVVIDNLEGAAWTSWDVADELTAQLLEELDVPLEPRPWPIAGSPLELTADRLFLELGPEIGNALRSWLEDDPFDPWRRFIAEMSTYVNERVWWWLEGASDYPGWRLSPPTAVWESLFLASRWPVLSDPPESIMAAWAASEQYVRDSGRQAIPVEVLDRIWREAGAPLLVLRADDATTPAEVFAPRDPDGSELGEVAFGGTVTEARARLARLLAEEASHGSARPWRPVPP